MFDIHYHAREGGSQSNNNEKLKYALVITIKAPNHVDLHNDIIQAYANTLVEIQPQLTIPEIELSNS